MFQTPTRIARTKVSQETFDLMMLAFKDIALARTRAERLCVFDFDFEVLSAFSRHPMPSVNVFASKLMLMHFPGRLSFYALKDFLDSPSVDIGERAKSLLISNHPGKLSDETLRAFATSMNAAVSRLANEVLNARFRVHQS